MNLEGRCALITGGGRGIGAGCAKALADSGANVVLTYRRDKPAADRVVAQIEAIGRKAIAIQCDVSDESQIIDTIPKVVSELGKLDILICNAGIASSGNCVRDTSTNEMRRVFDTHVMGSFWCIRESLDALRNAKNAHVILISSVATKKFRSLSAPYTMAKTAQESLMKVLVQEEGVNGIRVNTIAPGIIETDMGQRLVQANGIVDIKDLYQSFPFGRVGQPEDIGHLAVFLCSLPGSYINGQTIYVDGGDFQKSF